MTIKCLAFDLDGTLLTDQKEIDPRTKKSIQRAMEQGIHIVIASGRDKNGTSFVYEPLGLEQGKHYLALVNGQIIYDFEKKEYFVVAMIFIVIFRKPIVRKKSNAKNYQDNRWIMV